MKCVFCPQWLCAVALVALLSPLPSGAQQAPRFDCKVLHSSDCSCSTSGGDHFEVSCPRTANIPDFEFNIMSTYIHLKCSRTVKPEDYSKLPKIPSFVTSDEVTSFGFLGCPLPDLPLIEIINKLGTIKRLQSVYFQSHQRNLSNTLKKYHFQGLNGVQRLVLSGSALTELPEDLLSDMKNLTWLNLKGNRVHLQPGLFKGVPQLLLLELGNNDLKSLPDGLFMHSNNLNHLNLWQNRLTNLTSENFEGLDSLQILDLSENGIKEFDPDTFKHVPNLQTLDISRNNITTLPNNLFSNNKHLTLLKFNDNRDTLSILPSKLFSNMKNITEIYLKNSQIASLSEDVFWESTEITKIDLSKNLITEIQKDVFRDQSNLIELYLEENKITYLADSAFESLRKLKILNLNYNHITKLSQKHFSALVSLDSLYMKHNDLKTISYNAFLSTKKLRIIDMSYNNLSFMATEDNLQLMVDDFELKSPFGFIADNIESLNLSHNALTEIFSDWRITALRLKNLDLSYNKISKIVFNDVHFLSSQIQVDLQYNNISEIIFNEAESIALSQDIQQPSAHNAKSLPAHFIKVYVENNPINCDCLLFPFIKYLKNELDPQVPSLVTVIPGNVSCVSPPNLEGKRLIDLESNQLLCLLDDPSTKKPKCPSMCECFVRPSNKALIIDCSSKKLNSFVNLPDIKSLYLDHTELHFENNSINNITSLGLYGNNFNQITKMYLSGNNISQITVNDIPDSIEILDLRHNQLKFFDSPDVLKKLAESTTLKEMYFYGNPIDCGCKNHPFLSFLQSKYTKIKDLEKLKCGDGKRINQYKLSDLCDVSTAVIASSVFIAVGGLILGILGALYYKYHQEIKVWLFAKQLCLYCVTEEEVDKDKLYDAFVSFSHKDEDFVINKLVPELEGGPNPFKVCLHFRDWMAGEWIPTQIARSVQDSRRTVVVLSPNFLESVWGRLEFRAAHSRALKEGRARVIVILYGDIGPTDNLDPELQAYLSMNTYVKWGDPWFWNKLRYAMPHPPYSKHHLPTPGVLSKKGFDDRLELIHPTTPSTPPGQNTPPAHQAHTNPLMNHVNSMPNGVKSPNLLNGTITMNGLKINGNAKHSDV